MERFGNNSSRLLVFAKCDILVVSQGCEYATINSLIFPVHRSSHREVWSRVFLNPQLTLRQLIQPDLEPWFIARSQHLVSLLSQYWITGGNKIHPPIEGLVSPAGFEPTLFRKSASKVARLKVHATTPSMFCKSTRSGKKM